MAYQLSELNAAAAADPAAFMAQSDQRYQQKIHQVAEAIRENLTQSPVVLLSGPSGSGKTTTAIKIEEELKRQGVLSQVISMDNYFSPRRPGDVLPLAPDGQVDLESPDLLDWELLNAHFTALERREGILIPHFEFARQMRNDARAVPLTLKENQVVIFEGIHALNDRITAYHPGALRLYISARSDVVDNDGQVVFKRTWLRLARRAVRDHSFRGYSVENTLAGWANVRRGEKKYISPFKDSAHIKFDSSLPYEVCVMANYAKPILSAIPPESPRADEMLQLIRAFDRFTPIDPALVPGDSLLREFIGGSDYHY